MRRLAAVLAFAATAAAQDLDRISAARLEATVRALAGFGTRHTASGGDDQRGIRAARAWLKARFDAVEGLEAHEQVFQSAQTRRLAAGVEIANVYGVVKGTDPVAARRIYVVSGHYDSRASDGMDAESAAPGANDDASGVAVVLELARLFAAAPPEATVIFLCVAGEEQGLIGAAHFARRARAENWPIAGMFTNDIVGNTKGPDGKRVRNYVRVFSEGLPARENPMAVRMRRMLGAEWDGASRQLARYVREAAARRPGLLEVKLVFRPDRFLRGGDHLAFNEAGYAGVRFTEPFEDYARQHQDVREGFGDLPEHVDYAYLAEVAKVNAAALYDLARAPSAPGAPRIHAQRLENVTTLSWQAPPEKDVAHYEVVWRDTTEAFWTHARKVEETTVTLPLSKDNWHFGVRAVDKDGFKSPVAYPTPLR